MSSHLTHSLTVSHVTVNVIIFCFLIYGTDFLFQKLDCTPQGFKSSISQSLFFKANQSQVAPVHVQVMMASRNTDAINPLKA